MHQMIKSTFVILPLLAAGCAFTGPDHPTAPAETTRLEIKLESIDLEDAKFGNRKEIQLGVEIRNVGQTTVLLPTKGIGPMVDTDGGIAEVIYSPDIHLSTRDGFHIPVAKSELAIVELRPKEAILLGYTYEKADRVVIAYVNYSISREFAERYGVWHGELNSRTNAAK